MANINIRIDETTKRDAEIVFESLGMTATTAINIFYKQVIRTGSIPFELKTEKPNKRTLKAIGEVEKIESGKRKTKTYSNVDLLVEDLLK